MSDTIRESTKATGWGSSDNECVIPGLTPVVTLESLAAEGKFASVEKQLPIDIHASDFKFTLDGEAFDGFVAEIYAPGDDTGWAVVYEKHQSGQSHKQKLVRGDWRFEKTPMVYRTSPG